MVFALPVMTTLILLVIFPGDIDVIVGIPVVKYVNVEEPVQLKKEQ